MRTQDDDDDESRVELLLQAWRWKDGRRDGEASGWVGGRWGRVAASGVLQGVLAVVWWAGVGGTRQRAPSLSRICMHACRQASRDLTTRTELVEDLCQLAAVGEAWHDVGKVDLPSERERSRDASMHAGTTLANETCPIGEAGSG